MRKLVERSELSGRSKDLSLALLTALERAQPGGSASGTDQEEEEHVTLSEEELSLLAQVVLVAAGVEQLNIDRVEVRPATAGGRAQPAAGSGHGQPAVSPVIAALQSVLTRSGPAPKEIKKVRTGVGLAAAAAGPAHDRITAFVLEDLP